MKQSSDQPATLSPARARQAPARCITFSVVTAYTSSPESVRLGIKTQGCGYFKTTKKQEDVAPEFVN